MEIVAQFRCNAPVSQRYQEDYPEVAYADGPLPVGPDATEMTSEGFQLGVGIDYLILTWRELVRIEAVDPWPCIELEWKNARVHGVVTGNSRRTVKPWRAMDERTFEEKLVLPLIQHVEDHDPGSIVRGWLDSPHADWERVNEMPRDPSGDEIVSDYRVAARPPEKVILARRGAPKPIDTMLLWLSSRPSFPWKEQPREVILTKHHVWARRRDDSVWRIPRKTLRTSRRSKDDHIYVFGRCTRLYLSHERGCGLIEALDGQMTGFRTT
jgi:hypothetical protein